jgi:hypothetical protein
MHASVRRVGLTYAILAAIFIASAVGAYVFLAVMAPLKAPLRPAGFKIASHTSAAAARRRLPNLEPHENAEVDSQLSSVSVRCSISDAFPLGEPQEITLTLEKGQRGAAADLDDPRPCSAEPQTLKLATNVSALLQGPPDVMKFAPPDEKHYSVTAAAPVKWTWYVTPLKLGTYDAQIVVSTELKLAGTAENVQVWTPPVKIQVAADLGSRISYVMDWISAKPLVSSLVTALLMTLIAAITGRLRGWFGFFFRGKPRQDAAMPT